jgi:HPt (histidine-containing phosphotransfer) domain-containing protein
MSEAADKTTDLLAALWLRNRPIVEQRLALLDQTAAAAAAGVLAEPLRQEAVSCAHKLAGSLGMYGFDEGTRIAREMEVLLNAGSSDGARLLTLCGELRTAVFPEA